MAQRLTIEFNHAIYDTFNHKRGTQPDFAEDQNDNDLIDTLVNGDAVLDRKPGFFFKSIGNQFVVAFESERDKRKKTEAYFDVFWAPVEDVEKASLYEAIEFLQQYKTESFTEEISGEIKLQLTPLRNLVKTETPTNQDSVGWSNNNHTETSGQNRNEANNHQDTNRSQDRKEPQDDDDGFVDADKVADSANSQKKDRSTEADSHPNEQSSQATSESQREGWSFGKSGDQPDKKYSFNRPDVSYISQFWEQYRRQNFQMSATLLQIDRFNYAVDDTLKSISGISDERKESNKFNIIIQKPAGKVSLENLSLKSQVSKLDSNNNLSFSELPSYREEIKKLKNQGAEEIKKAEDLESELDDIIEECRNNLEDAFYESNNHFSNLFVEIMKGKASDSESESGKRLPSLKNVAEAVRGNENDNKELDSINQLDLNSISEEEVDYLIENISREETDNKFEDRYEEIVSSFESELRKFSKKQKRKSAKTILRQVDLIRNSKAYDRARKEQ